MQEKARVFKSSWCYSRFLIHFYYTQKVAKSTLIKKQPTNAKSGLFCAKASNFNPLKPDLLTLYRRPNPIQNMINLRCTADHNAVPPLNIRPVESGIIPDHFSTGWKTDPAHHDLSERARPTPLYLDQHTLSPIKARSLPIRPFFQSGRERGLIGSLVWTGLLVGGVQGFDFISDAFLHIISWRDFYYDVYTILNQIELTIWTIWAFRVLNPRQWSLAKNDL